MLHGIWSLIIISAVDVEQIFSYFFKQMNFFFCCRYLFKVKLIRILERIIYQEWLCSKSFICLHPHFIILFWKWSPYSAFVPWLMLILYIALTILLFSILLFHFHWLYLAHWINYYYRKWGSLSCGSRAHFTLLVLFEPKRLTEEVKEYPDCILYLLYLFIFWKSMD